MDVTITLNTTRDKDVLRMLFGDLFTELPVNTKLPEPVEETDEDPRAGVDAKGNPWDERIHSSSGAKVQDGTWKYKRGVDMKLVAQIEGGAVEEEINPYPFDSPDTFLAWVMECKQAGTLPATTISALLLDLDKPSLMELVKTKDMDLMRRFHDAAAQG